MKQKPIEFRVPVAIPTEPWAWQSASLAEKASSLAESNSARERQRASQRSVFRPSAHVRGSYYIYINCFLLFISPSCLTRLIGFYPIFFPLLFFTSGNCCTPPSCCEPCGTATASTYYFLFFFILFFLPKNWCNPLPLPLPLSDSHHSFSIFFLSFTPPNTAPRAQHKGVLPDH